MNLATTGMGYTFGVFGKLGLVSAALPYAWAHVSGRVFEQAGEVHRSGLGDARLKFSVNLIGNDAMGAGAFSKAPRATIVGASLTAITPTGQYYGDNEYGIHPAKCYAQGWSLIWFLRTGEKNKAKGWQSSWGKILDVYLETLAQTGELDTAVDKAFEGVDWEALEKSWASYIG